MLVFNNIILYVLAFIITFILSYLLMPFAINLSYKIGAIDFAEKGSRKIHVKNTPRLGGLFIYISFIIGCIFFIEYITCLSNSNSCISTTQLEIVTMCGFIIIVMGILDDISPLEARKKLLIQILVASLIVIKGELVVQNIDIFFNMPLPFIIDKIFTIAWILLVINAVNLLDGLDALASGISIIVLLTIIVIALTINTTVCLSTIVVCSLLLGSICGFYPYNFPPAKLFMGDTGSQFIGYMLSILSIYGYKQAIFSSFLIPILILVIPLLDTVLSFFRRIVNRVSTSKADKFHIHHIVLYNVKSVKHTLVIFYIVSMLFSFTAIIYSLDKILGFIFFSIVFLISELLLEYFLIVSVYYWPLLKIYFLFKPNSPLHKKHYRKIMQNLRNKKDNESDKCVR